jgi:hypothetical protein
LQRGEVEVWCGQTSHAANSLQGFESRPRTEGLHCRVPAAGVATVPRLDDLYFEDDPAGFPLIPQPVHTMVEVPVRLAGPARLLIVGLGVAGSLQCTTSRICGLSMPKPRG